MPESELNLWDYWRIVRKRKWIVIAVIVISVVSASLFRGKTVPVYKTSVTLHIGTARTPIAEITGSGVTFWGGSVEDISTRLALIRSYNSLRDVALRLGYITPDTDSEKVQAAVLSLRGKIRVSAEDDTNLVVIGARDTDPHEAKRIAQTVADVFIHKSWEKKIQEARNTKKFVEEQLEKKGKAMADIRRKLEAAGAGAITGKIQAGAADLRTRAARLRLRLSDLRTRYTDNYPEIMNLLAEIKNVDEQMERVPEEVRKSALVSEAIDVQKLRDELAINQKLYIMLKERYEKARILEASQTEDIEIVDPAVIPSRPVVVGKRVMNNFLSGIIGLMLGLLAAFLAESMDTSIDTIEDVEEYLRLTVLGVIPHISIGKKTEVDYFKNPPPQDERKAYYEIVKRIIMHLPPGSLILEAYRNLQTYIKFSGLDKVGNCLMFTSAGIREGKTTTCVNSALSMAQLGYKVLLVDADLRNPNVHRIFGIEKEMGLTEVVLGTFQLEDVVRTIDDLMMGNIKSSLILKTYGMENLHIITAGHLAGNPTEILGSRNMSRFIEKVKSRFQVVFFDSAPILPVTDTSVLGSKVDGIILVYEVGRVSRGALRRSKLQIENARGKPIGVVLNSMRVSDMAANLTFYHYPEAPPGSAPEKTGGIIAKQTGFSE